MGALQNRLELLSVEWQEERNRLAGLMLAAISVLLLGMVGLLLLTATIIFVVPDELRKYVAAALGFLSLIGAVVGLFGLKRLVKGEPFAETLGQLKKDFTWQDSSN